MFNARIVREVCFHGTCTFYVPIQILHHYRQRHPLHIKIASIKSGKYCFVCEDRYGDSVTFFCGNCKGLDEIHGSCSSDILPSFRSYYHNEHDLTYFRKVDYQGDNFSPIRLRCAKCNVQINLISDHYKGFYGCVECGINFHLSCILPPVVQYKYRSDHLLALQNNSKARDCKICETTIDSNDGFYSCLDHEGDFDAHIGCTLINQNHHRRKQNHFSVFDKKQNRTKQFFCHVHPLSYGNPLTSRSYTCTLCLKFLSGYRDCFYCKSCEGAEMFIMHKQCGEQPEEINHLYHPNHRLRMVILKLVKSSPDPLLLCNACWVPLEGFCYSCFHCEFNLHLFCARFSSWSPEDHRGLFQKKITFKLSCHHHDLILYPGSVYEFCMWCKEKIYPSDKFYGCRGCDIFLHEACAFQVPERILHPSHKKHPLRLRIRSGRCFACKKWSPNSIFYACEDCRDIGVHGICASILPSLRSEYHHHNLAYFPGTCTFSDLSSERVRYLEISRESSCGKCGERTLDREEGLYSCMTCKNRWYHLRCILPSAVTHKYHNWHRLSLQKPIKDDFYREYYCDICETQRNPDHYLYTCEECTNFDAHIECALNQERNQPYDPVAIIRSLKVPDSTPRKALIGHGQEVQLGQIKHPHHDHVLNLEDVNKCYCRGCNLIVSGKAYTCATCPDYCLHEVCANLSRHPSKPFHSPLHHLHPLVLYFGYSHGKWFQCDACGDINKQDCFNYRCPDCEFVIDFKCVAFKHKYVTQARRMKKLTIESIHRHRLYVGNYISAERSSCRACGLPISGLTYCCLLCDFFLHISCIGRFSQKLQLPFYSRPFQLGIQKEETSPCLACQLPLSDFYLYYTCRDYVKPFFLHPICAVALKQPLIYKAHMHVLYYFGRDNQLMFEGLRRKQGESGGWFRCNECGKDCNEAFYRCVKCEWNLHLECVPIPRVVNSKRHMHQLRLKESFIDKEYDHDDQYCDVCEDKRSFKDHVYQCEECSIPFTSHIECVLNKLEFDLLHDLRLEEKLM